MKISEDEGLELIVSPEVPTTATSDGEEEEKLEDVDAMETSDNESSGFNVSAEICRVEPITATSNGEKEKKLQAVTAMEISENGSSESPEISSGGLGRIMQAYGGFSLESSGKKLT